MDFTSLEDLKIRIYPALRNRVSYFKKLGVNDKIVNDILNCNYLNIRYYKERINYEKR